MTLIVLYSHPLFNPYDIGDYDDNLYNDDFELHVDSINVAYSILDQCNYVASHNFKNYLSKSQTSLYFHNIDGMKSNFNEFILHYKSLDYEFDFLCFAETNIEQDEINQFSISNTYNCEILPKKAEKHKGSGLVLYFKKSLNFSVVDSLCRSNNDYEMLGGKLKTDFGFIYIIGDFTEVMIKHFFKTYQI